MLDKLEMVSPHADLFTELMAPALTYIALGFGINFIYRIYDYLALRLMPSLYNDIVIQYGWNTHRRRLRSTGKVGRRNRILITHGHGRG